MRLKSAFLALAAAFLCLGGAISHSANPTEVAAWSGTQVSNEGDYYEPIRGLVGDELLDGLNQIIDNAHVSYDWSRFEAADEAPNDPNSIVAVYSRRHIGKNHKVNSYSDGWNREHSYPDSKMSGAGDSDNHIIFASDNKVNGARGNKKLGIVSDHSDPVIDAFGDPTDCYTTSSVFEPCDEAKGEVARATLYASVMYGLSITGNFTSLDLCLEWNEEFPVSDREIYRNNTVYTLQNNRNPFVDHPEFARMIFDDSYDGPGALEGTDSPVVPVESVSFGEDSYTLELGDRIRLDPVVLPADATDTYLSYSSSNLNIAYVTQSGYVTALGVGEATITVKTSNAKTDTCLIQVVSESSGESSQGTSPTEPSSSESGNGGSGCFGSIVPSAVSLGALLLGLSALLLFRYRRNKASH